MSYAEINFHFCRLVRLEKEQYKDKHWLRITAQNVHGEEIELCIFSNSGPIKIIEGESE